MRIYDFRYLKCLLYLLWPSPLCLWPQVNHSLGQSKEFAHQSNKSSPRDRSLPGGGETAKPFMSPGSLGCTFLSALEQLQFSGSIHPLPTLHPLRDPSHPLRDPSHPLHLVTCLLAPPLKHCSSLAKDSSYLSHDLLTCLCCVFSRSQSATLKLIFHICVGCHNLQHTLGLTISWEEGTVEMMTPTLEMSVEAQTSKVLAQSHKAEQCNPNQPLHATK